MHEKYHHKNGTHCVYCNRDFASMTINKTKDHIIPKSFGRQYKKTRRNQASCCGFCNSLKKNRTAKQFAEFVEMLLSTPHPPHSPKLLKRIKNGAWKAYNKTHKTHQSISRKTMKKMVNKYGISYWTEV